MAGDMFSGALIGLGAPEHGVIGAMSAAGNLLSRPPFVPSTRPSAAETSGARNADREIGKSLP